MVIGDGNSDWDEVFRDPKELHKNIDTTGSVDQLDYLEQVMALAMHGGRNDNSHGAQQYRFI